MRYKSLFRFAIVGCINTGIDFLTFGLLHKFLLIDKLICQIAGYSMGTINSFIMNKLWTFESKGTKPAKTRKEFIQFLTVNLASLGVSLLCLQILNGYYGLNVYASKIVATVIAQVVNYVGYKCWVFNVKESGNI